MKGRSQAKLTALVTPPPHGPPWDSPIAQAPLAFVDLEMTGLDAERDRVVELCIERTEGDGPIARLSTLVDPRERAGGGAEVHGIVADALVGAPPFERVAGDVLAILEGAVVVAHAASWDVRFLQAEFTRVGQSFDVPHWLDTVVLARRAFAFPSYSLGALCGELGIPRGRAHRADSDVLALRAVFARCVEALEPVSVRDLWDVRVGQGRARPAIVDACQAAAGHGSPVVLTYRAARRASERLEMVLLEVLSDLDPPRVVGYLLPGRGRRTLRADRILRVEPTSVPPRR